MTQTKSSGSKLSSASTGTRLVIAMAILPSILLCVFFFRRIHVPTTIICCLIAPSVLFAVLLVVRPQWLERYRSWSKRELERMGEGLEKRPPAGLP